MTTGAVERSDYNQLVPYNLPNQKSFRVSSLWGNMMAYFAGGSAGAMLGAEYGKGAASLAGISVGATSSSLGATVGKLFYRAMTKSDSTIVNTFVGAMGGAFFATSLTNITFTLSTEKLLTETLAQIDIALGGAAIGAMTTSLFGESNNGQAARAGAIASLGIGTFTASLLGAGLGYAAEDIGITKGLMLGYSGMMALAGYLIPTSDFRKKAD